MKALIFAISLLPTICFAADRQISAAEFEALVTGKTLSYANPGSREAYGAETYLKNRRVQWSYLDGECTDGEWYTSGEQICFVYDALQGPQCWTFFLRGDRLVARYESDTSFTELIETERMSEPLYCKGPDVGA